MTSSKETPVERPRTAFPNVIRWRSTLLLTFIPCRNYPPILPQTSLDPWLRSRRRSSRTGFPIFSTPDPPVNLRKISIGDGTIGGFALYEELSTVITLETYPEIIGFDPDVFQYFKEQYALAFPCGSLLTGHREHLCGYNVNLTYPQKGIIPTIIDPFSTTTSFSKSQLQPQPLPRKRSLSCSALSAAGSLASRDLDAATVAEREQKRAVLKRNLTGRPNGTLDPMYGCFLWEEMTDYAMNFTFPWTVGEFDPYDIPDALHPEVPTDASVFMNDNRTRSALHAPFKEWVKTFSHPFGNSTGQGSVIVNGSVSLFETLDSVVTHLAECGVTVEDMAASYYWAQQYIWDMTISLDRNSD
ncbi:hypothetical protein BT96DRAFT_981706 [Gymnopus androsaceus JB14]|uniref:Uncharacterized protein n=1 Tax=Gymnopus androsaceus JB14 TaxID=1447944 RepID=A0A6A4GMN3_9AGAR|nr:hypothetical protein BT96DRAFT_981706 [Gymnopus androsaceus JB14]